MSNGFIDFDAAAREAIPNDGFIVLGEKFRVHSITIEEMNAYWDTDKSDLSNAETTDLISDLIEKFLYEEDVPRWHKLLGRKENPLSSGLLMGIFDTLLERQTARPTLPPASSASGRGATPGGSGGARHSQVVVPGN